MPIQIYKMILCYFTEPYSHWNDIWNNISRYTLTHTRIGISSYLCDWKFVFCACSSDLTTWKYITHMCGCGNRWKLKGTVKIGLCPLWIPFCPITLLLSLSLQMWNVCVCHCKYILVFGAVELSVSLLCFSMIWFDEGLTNLPGHAICFSFGHFWLLSYPDLDSRMCFFRHWMLLLLLLFDEFRILLCFFFSTNSFLPFPLFTKHCSYNFHIRFRGRI